ncbi:MAG TPA: Co2+/Mg2+ efflux protein ApaG [bacterium]|nr:Co2+/Mg2+ efflux protein ApaG [bacterium]
MSTSPHSDTTTEGIRIYAAAEYLPQEVLPQEFREPDHGGQPEAPRSFVFRYKITMTNVGEQRARLLSRHWSIVDGEGQREEVRGRGVVGEFPLLAAGDSYSYVSYCPLQTSWGTMEGHYTFERDDGSRFEVAIGRFFLVPSAPPLQLESPSL